MVETAENKRAPSPFTAWLRLLVILLVATAFSTPDVALADDPKDILIVANNGVSVDKLEPNALREIFLKRRATWPDGERIVAINAPPGAPLRQTFLSRVLRMSETEEATYWNEQRARTGTVVAPPEFTSTLKAVFKLKGSVSYVFREDYRANVAKILVVLPAK